MSGDEEEGYVVRVRGLPWSATKEEIENFFGDITLKDGLEGIHMTVSKEGRPSGEAYVELNSEEDFQKALEKHKEHMGHRYIEVFKSKKSEMVWVMKRSGVNQQDSLSDGCVRLRGLPFGCSKEEISQFFSGLEIVPNGISLPTDHLGRSTGEAFVQFSSRDIAEKAMGKHKEKIGHRYIEIFKSSLQEIKIACGLVGSKVRGVVPNRPSPYDRADRFGNMSMRFGMGRGSRFYRGYDGYGEFGSQYGSYNDFNGYGHPMNDQYHWNGRFDNSFDGRRFSGSVHGVRMRGLPFQATTQDIWEFFRSANVTPVRIRVKEERNGRPSGEADVYFSSHEDAIKAMTKDKANMRHRYIELFLKSTPNHASDGYGGKRSCMGRMDGFYNEYAGNFGNNTNSMIGGSNYSEF